jgi:hypothetical protein
MLPRRENQGMLDDASKQRVKELCDLIAKEQNAYRFSDLLRQLNAVLDGSDGATRSDRVDKPEGADKPRRPGDLSLSSFEKAE